MKILAINGSPKGTKSNTDLILQPFLQGAVQAGADTETVYLSECTINPCSGCMSCWFSTPGECVHKDDMNQLLEKFKNSDLIVYASPLYTYTVSGLMKTFMDRCLPMVTPEDLKEFGKHLDPSRLGRWPKKVVLISNSGFPGRHLFSPLVETFKILLGNPFYEFKAQILCPTGTLLSFPELEGKFSWYFEGLNKAGKEMVVHGEISPETQAVLDKDLAGPDDLVRMSSVVGIDFAS